MLAKDLKKGLGAASVLKGWTSEQADAESGRTQRDHRSHVYCLCLMFPR